MNSGENCVTHRSKYVLKRSRPFLTISGVRQVCIQSEIIVLLLLNIVLETTNKEAATAIRETASYRLCRLFILNDLSDTEMKLNRI